MSGENLISQMSNYFEFLSQNAEPTEALWTSPYLDAWGLGIMLTHAIPVNSKITGKYEIFISLNFVFQLKIVI